MMDSTWRGGDAEVSEAIYAELLHQAHVEGLYGLTVCLLQAPAPENGYTALVQAEARTGQGVFSALGEAGDDEAPDGVIATAEMRAKVRALRDALDAPEDAFHGDEAEHEERRDWPRRLDWGYSPVAHTASEEIARRIAVLTARRPHLALLRGGPQ